jgi:hypothetical protein
VWVPFPLPSRGTHTHLQEARGGAVRVGARQAHVLVRVHVPKLSLQALDHHGLHGLASLVAHGSNTATPGGECPDQQSNRSETGRACLSIYPPPPTHTPIPTPTPSEAPYHAPVNRCEGDAGVGGLIHLRPRKVHGTSQRGKQKDSRTGRTRSRRLAKHRCEGPRAQHRTSWASLPRRRRGRKAWCALQPLSG